MKLSITLAIFLIVLVSLSPVLATTYIIEHDDEVDQIKEMQEQSTDRVGYDTELTRLQQQIEELRSQYAQQESERTARDYYDRLGRYGDYRSCDREDLDDLDDLLDENDTDRSSDDRREFRRLLRRCGLDGDAGRYDDGYLGRYGADTDCRLLSRDYADNFSYDDYLYDVHRAGRCSRARMHLKRNVFDNYFNDFEDRFDDHDTSYDPYTDVLHELDDQDFFKYGPGAYASWGRWCEQNRYRDGSLPDWCHERRRFISNVDWD